MIVKLSKLRAATGISAAAMALTAPTALYAQAEYRFDLPAQALEISLKEIGSKTGSNVVFDAKAVKGKRAPALEGSYSPEAAIHALIKGTGLSLRRTSGGSYVIGSARVRDAVGNGVLTGSVRDNQTGSALKGASVEIVETGDKASTDDLGEFRFNRLPAGDVTLRVSYLGFPEQSETITIIAGQPNSVGILLGSQSTASIIVTAYKSARAQAINQERTNENSSTVISSDLLGDFSGSTISDALRRAPGVSFVRDQRTGDGTNIIVRGLEPNLNQVVLNGVVVPEGTGVGRAADLNNILADSIDKVTISKTLLPSQDNAGTGGLVEIETKSPLDRARRYANFSADTTLHGKGFGKEYSLSGILSGKFGASENFGLSASVQYRKQDIRSRTGSTEMNYGDYLPVGPGGVPFEFYDVDPRVPFPFDGASNAYPYTTNLGINDVDQSTLSATLAAEWKIGDHTTLQADWVYSDLRSKVVGRSFRLFAPSSFGPDLVDGEPRNVLMASGFASLSQNISESRTRNRTNSFSLRGTTDLDQFEVKYHGGYAKGQRDVPYAFSASFGQSFGISQSDLDPSLIDPQFGYAHSIFPARSGDGAPVPLLTGTALDRLYDASNYGFTGATLTSNEGSNRILSSDASIRWSPDRSVLKYFELGGSYRDSSFVNNASILGSQDATFQIDPADPFTKVFASQLGVSFDHGELGETGFPLLSRNTVGLFYRNGGAISNPLYVVTDIPVDPLSTQSKTVEREFSGYVQANLNFNKVEVIGGIRIDHMDVNATYLSGPNIFDANYNIDLDFQASARELIKDSVSGTDFLPRILLNYRPTENLVFRAGYYTTVARPAIRDLGARQDVTLYEAPEFGPQGNQKLLIVTKGNPSLKPAVTSNFDVGGEWYSNDIGVIKVNLFYKNFKNLLEANTQQSFDDLVGVTLPDDPRFSGLDITNTSLVITQPANNGFSAHLYGAEVSVERHLTFLPGVLSAFGIYANYTYTKGSKKEIQNFGMSRVLDSDGNWTGEYETVQYVIDGFRFRNQASHSATAGLTYNKNGIDAALFYTYQSKRLLSYGVNNLHEFFNPIDSLDFRLDYRFGKNDRFKLSVVGSDLLKGKDAANSGQSQGGLGKTPSFVTSSYYTGGRALTLGAAVSF